VLGVEFGVAACRVQPTVPASSRVTTSQVAARAWLGAAGRLTR
jgi:hypothetical protein